MRRKIVLLGVHPLATLIARDLIARDGAELVAVIAERKNKVSKDPWDEPYLYDFASEAGLPTYLGIEEFLQDFEGQTVDMALNVRMGKLLRSPFLEKFTMGVVNTHGGILPERAGVNIPCFNILLGDTEGGATLHYIDSGVDTGDIVDTQTFPIEPADTAMDLWKKTQATIWQVYQDNIEGLLAGTNPRRPQAELLAAGRRREVFKGKDLAQQKVVDPTAMTPDEIDRRVRAFDFPGHEPAHLLVDGRKIWLTTRGHLFEEERAD